MEEEKRKVTDQEEAQYQEQQRKEANEKAQSQLFYQTDRVKGLHVGVAPGRLSHVHVWLYTYVDVWG